MPEGYTVEEAKAAIDGVCRSFEDYKKENDAALAEAKKSGEISAETKQKLERIEEQISKHEELKERLDRIEAFTKRSGPSQKDASGNQLSEVELEHKEAVIDYMRKGDIDDLSDLEVKALAVQSDPDGGYFVSADMSGRIVERIFETSPMRQVASVVTISTDALEGTYDDDEAGAEWVGETDPRTNDETPKVGKWRIPVHEMSTKPKATQKLLDDAAVNIEAWLQGKVSRRFGRKENAAFINGNGVAKPEGILFYPDAADPEVYQRGAVGTIETAAADTVDFDDLMDFFDLLKEEYMVGARLAGNRRNWKVLRKIKGTDGHYIWEPSMQVGQPAQVLGVPLISFNDMPVIAASGGTVGAFALADFADAYQIVDRQGVRVLRDPYSSKPFVEFYTTKRVGGAVLNFDAIKRLNVKS